MAEIRLSSTELDEEQKNLTDEDGHSQISTQRIDYNLCISRAQTITQATDLDIFWAFSNSLPIN